MIHQNSDGMGAGFQGGGKLMNEMNWSQYDKALDEASNEAAELTRKGARKDGVPFTYRDKFGRPIKEYPDGRRYEIAINGDGKKEIPFV